MKTSRPMALSHGVFALSFTLMACGDPLKFPQDLEETRVIGVQVQSDSGYGWPGADESAEVRVLVAGPDGPAQLETAYQVCLAPETSRGVPYCAGSALATGQTPSSDDVSFSFEGRSGLLPEQRVVILGVGCESGQTKQRGSPKDWGCSDGSNALRFSYETEAASVQNKNPQLDRTVLSYDNVEVEFEATKVAPTCSGPRILAEHTALIQLKLDTKAAEAEEVLQLSHFSSRGRFERQYTILDVDADLSAESAIISGIVKGNVVVKTSLVITETGRLIGNVHCQSLAIREGAYFSGAIKMTEPKPVENA